MAIVINQQYIDEPKCCPCAPPSSPLNEVRKKFCFDDVRQMPLSARDGKDIDIREFLVASLARMNVGSSSLKRKQRNELCDYPTFEAFNSNASNGKKLRFSSAFDKEHILPIFDLVEGRKKVSFVSIES